MRMSIQILDGKVPGRPSSSPVRQARRVWSSNPAVVLWDTSSMVCCERPTHSTWDGNETWLIMAGITLLAGFPLAYSVLLPAFYLPLVVMLLSLGLRGVSFEFRFRRRAGDRSGMRRSPAEASSPP